MKGEDIHLMDIHENSILAEFFVICSGTSKRMVKGLMVAVQDEVKKKFQMMILDEDSVLTQKEKSDLMVKLSTQKLMVGRKIRSEQGFRAVSNEVSKRTGALN